MFHYRVHTASFWCHHGIRGLDWSRLASFFRNCTVRSVTPIKSEKESSCQKNVCNCRLEDPDQSPGAQKSFFCHSLSQGPLFISVQSLKVKFRIQTGRAFLSTFYSEKQNDQLQGQLDSSF
ncbi:uncharacterized protein LOC113508297 [Trichoplusia ni]|uniref:Uncharacterized protein LOC113508297 n=1 Tax=Trichoplusia ni TaxID=7111 RepID=A0A7E5X1K6_TRINI|nr:uncharacterized protein LOC113508297 [Trichoplusia ni]